MQTPSPYILSQLSFLLSSLPFVTAYGPKLKVDITFPPDEDRTKQSFKDESDINHIMARYQKTGVLDFAEKHSPQYGDVTGLEFQAGMELIKRAQAMFSDLPSSVRTRFENDPAKFLDFVHDDANREEAAAMGLLKPQAEWSTPPTTPPAADAANEPTARRKARRGESEGEPPSTDKTNSPT